MLIFGYRLNLDALAARLIYRWRGRTLVGIFVALCGIALTTGVIPPVWRGQVYPTVYAMPGSTITVDGRAWPAPIYAGRHRFVAQSPDGHRSWLDLALQPGAAPTLTLPMGLGDVQTYRIPPAGPLLRVAHVAWVGGSWRAIHEPLPAPTPEGRRQTLTATPPPGAIQTMAFGANGAERLTTIDAYGGLADQQQIGDHQISAVYLPVRDGYRSGSIGRIEVRGWNAPTASFTLSNPLSLLQIAPDGTTVIAVEQTTVGSEQALLLRPDRPPTPLVAVPGRVTRLAWRDDGSALVVLSRVGDRLTLTLLRLRPVPTALALAELDATIYADSLVPLAWSPDGLFWIAPEFDSPAIQWLWSVSLSALLPTRHEPIDARAMTVLPDGTLRIVRIIDGQVTIGRYREGMFFGEAVVPDVQPSRDLGGVWHGAELLIAGDARYYLVRYREGGHDG